jgi:hypothetical protein
MGNGQSRRLGLEEAESYYLEALGFGRLREGEE